jgi:uncharacterized protein YndB with AHSA1/START domain
MSTPSGGARAILVVRRLIHAPPEAVFAAWTSPRHLIEWWGPTESVRCPAAEVDLSVGGRYRIANRFPDGRVVWISGVFELIEPPRKLVFTWQLEPPEQDPQHAAGAERALATERVTVEFEPRGVSTEVIVTHERIPDEAARTGHEQGWLGCLDGLARYAESPQPA